jgi:cbb3-type cytochrome oxidase subunit 3
MGHSLGDAYIVIALSAVWIAYLYFRYRERQRRLEVLHQERMAAMDKGIPLPELPLERLKPPPDPRMPLLHGIVWLAFGIGGVGALAVIGPVGNMPVLWPFALPLVFLGAGLVLYYVLASRTRQ